jgi:putative DNA primase/helicase
MKTSEIDRAIEALSYIPANLPRDEWHEVLRAGVAADIPFEELDRWSATGSNYKGPEDVRAALKGINPDGGTGPGTLFFIAKKYGYRASDKNGLRSQNSYSTRRFPAQLPFADIAYRLAEFAASCEPAPASHPYIKRKLGLPAGLLVYRGNKPVDGRNCEGSLVFPLFNLDGTPASFQLVPPVGKKKYFLKDVSLPREACMVVGGELLHAQKAYVVEGVGQAWTAHQATRSPAVVCFGKGRMAGVAKAIHDRYPHLVLIIVPDAGGQQKAARIAQVVGGLYVDLPGDWPPNYDINDFHKEKGNLEAVALLIQSAKTPDVGTRVAVSEILGNTLNDAGNAARLVKLFGQDIRWLSEIQKWVIWKDHHWEIDEDGAIMRLAKTTAQSIYREAADEPDTDKARSISKWASTSHSLSRLLAMIELARAELNITVPMAVLDQKDLLLGTPSGVVDLTTGMLSAASRSDYITRTTSAKYQRDATCPAWEKFLDRCFSGNQEMIDYIQRAVGYSLTGKTDEQVMFFIYGTGCNGKSVFLETLRAVLGDYGMQAQAEMLMQSKGERASNDIARLRGARMVSAIETEDGRKLAESLVKQLTGGDSITARFLYREFFEYKPTYKLWWAGNHKPIIPGDDFAMWRRMHLITFGVTILEHELDKQLSSKLAAEAAGILQWVLKGCLEWCRMGLKPPPEIVEATQQYRSEMDIFSNWLKDCCAVGPEKLARANVLITSHSTWAQQNGFTPLNPKKLSSKLQDHGFCKDSDRYGIKYLGLSLLYEE